jgi:hypothetical protein
MNQTDRLRRSKELELSQSRRLAAQLQAIIADFDRTCLDLGHQIAAEETRFRNYDPMDFAYPTFAKAARERRAKLQRSADAFRILLQKQTCEATEGADRQVAA